MNGNAAAQPGHVSPGQRYKQVQASRRGAESQRGSALGASSSAAAPAGAGGVAGRGSRSRNRSYSELAAQRAKKASHASQQKQNRSPNQAPRRAVPQRQSPQGVVTKFRDITDIPDHYGPIQFTDPEHDYEHENDSLEGDGDGAVDLRQSSFGRGGYQENDARDQRYPDSDDSYEQHPRQTNNHASYVQRASYNNDDSSEDDDSDIDAQISRLQSQIAQFDMHQQHRFPSNARGQRSSPAGQSASQPKPMSKKELLVYSKKARPVEFKPYTLKEFQKKHKHSGYYEVGNLQPDLNTDELKAKRENLQRVKEFSRQLREFNARAAATKPPVFDVHDQPKEPSTRDKALEFAKSIPKPKPKQNPNRRSQQRTPGDDVEEQIQVHRSKLDELEEEHELARKQVEAIKRSLGF